MTLTKAEQETIINYDNELREAYCYTYDKRMINRLDAHCEKSTDITVVREGDGWREYKFPKRWINVKMPRQLSDEQRAELAERMRRITADKSLLIGRTKANESKCKNRC